MSRKSPCFSFSRVIYQVSMFERDESCCGLPLPLMPRKLILGTTPLLLLANNQTNTGRKLRAKGPNKNTLFVLKGLAYLDAPY